MKKLLLFLLLLSGFIYSQPGGLFPHSIHCWHFTQGAIDCIKDTVFAYISPIPIDSLADSTFTVIADSGVGGGGTANLGDTLYIRNHVDSVTIDIFKDTLRVDTSNIATKYYVNDTLSAYWDSTTTITVLGDSLSNYYDTTEVKQIVSDSSQYYYWRSKSGYHFPEWDDMVLWNWNDFRTNQDSVTVCYFKDPTTYYNYMQAERASGAVDSHYVFPSFDFVAPRDVSDISDTLFIIRYKTTSADTLNVGVKPMIYEGTTARYVPTDIVASTSWTTMTVRKSYGTLSSIVAGDEFSLILYCKLDGDSLWVGRIEERWY